MGKTQKTTKILLKTQKLVFFRAKCVKPKAPAGSSAVTTSGASEPSPPEDSVRTSRKQIASSETTQDKGVRQNVATADTASLGRRKGATESAVERPAKKPRAGKGLRGPATGGSQAGALPTPTLLPCEQPSSKHRSVEDGTSAKRRRKTDDAAAPVEAATASGSAPRAKRTAPVTAKAAEQGGSKVKKTSAKKTKAEKDAEKEAAQRAKEEARAEAKAEREAAKTEAAAERKRAKADAAEQQLLLRQEEKEKREREKAEKKEEKKRRTEAEKAQRAAEQARLKDVERKAAVDALRQPPSAKEGGPTGTVRKVLLLLRELATLTSVTDDTYEKVFEPLFRDPPGEQVCFTTGVF